MREHERAVGARGPEDEDRHAQQRGDAEDRDAQPHEGSVAAKPARGANANDAEISVLPTLVSVPVINTPPPFRTRFCFIDTP